jgi:hypothetical protein
MFDMSQINDDDFHIDMGFMYGIPSQASNVPGDSSIDYTTLPRQCCLKALIKGINNLIPDVKDSLKVKGTYYTWGLIKDVASLTIDLPPNHPLRDLGLDFLQIYPTIYEIHLCARIFKLCVL